MINNNQILPLYLQKSIIKIICNHINKENKITTEYLDGDIGLDYRERENETKLLMINTALVSSDWFKSCSIYLNVSVDLNFTNSKYSIIKPDNINIIKLHYDHKEGQRKFYKMKHGKKVDIDDTIKQVYEIIKENKSISKIIIRNINFIHDDFMELMETLVKHFPRNGNDEECSIKSFSFLTYEISPSTTMEILKLHNGYNLKNVSKLCITDLKDKDTYQYIFKIWSKSIKHIEIDPIENEDGFNIGNEFNLFQMINNEKHLSNLKFLNIFMMDVTCNDLSNILDNCKLLSNLSFNFCFNSILHFFMASNDRTEDLEIPCSCDSLVKFSQNDREIQFLNDWNNLKKSFSNSIHLNQIEIGQNCNYYDPNLHWETGKSFPIEVNNAIASLVLSIPNLTILYFFGSTTTPDIFYKIANNNKSIIHLKSSFNDIDCTADKYKSGVELFLNQYSHIKTFQLVRLSLNSEDEIILNYNSNSMNK